jgi:hypothetical protein
VLRTGRKSIGIIARLIIPSRIIAIINEITETGCFTANDIIVLIIIVCLA